ncbi:MAG: hypothetical protein IKY02_06645 [Lachnospiraceae bacterium]|nr:hypothetical protein [Lachnospiraceae bacterium]
MNREEMERAVQEVAFGFFLKHGKIQYDSMEVNLQDKPKAVEVNGEQIWDGLPKFFFGEFRSSVGASLEDATSDSTTYTVCSDYVFNVYRLALGYSFGVHPLNSVTVAFWLHPDPGMVVARWKNVVYDDVRDQQYGVTDEKRMGTEEMRAFLSDYEKNLRPGDILDIKGTGGHAMLYIGGGYVLDSWGSKYIMEEGLEKPETTGTVRTLHKLTDIFVDGNDPVTHDGYMIRDNEKKPNIGFILLRPIDVLLKSGVPADREDVYIPKELKRPVFGISNATRSRVKYPGMDVDRTVDGTVYTDVEEGGAFSVTVRVFNKSDDPKYCTFRTAVDGTEYRGETYRALPILERIPKGTVISERSFLAGGKVYSGKEIEALGLEDCPALDPEAKYILWKADVLPGSCFTARYTLRPTGKRGESVTLGGGFVAAIPSNTLTKGIGGKKIASSRCIAATNKLNAVDALIQDQLPGRKFFAESPDSSHAAVFKNRGAATEDLRAANAYAMRWASPLPLKGSDTAMIGKLYKDLFGITVDLPSSEKLFRTLFESRLVEREHGLTLHRDETFKARMIQMKKAGDAEFEKYRGMIPEGYTGGRRFYTDVMNREPRINEFRTEYLETGDILLYTMFKPFEGLEDPWQADVRVAELYAGNGRFLGVMEGNEERMKTLGFYRNMAYVSPNGQFYTTKEEIPYWGALSFDLFYVLRPSRVVPDINQGL